MAKTMITLKELAKIAGVSISAVSKALNNCSDINSDTRERILMIAKENGYVKKQKYEVPGKIGNIKRPLTIAVIYSDLVSNYYTKLIKEFDARISEMGGIMLMSSAQFKNDRMVELIKFFQDTQIADALVLVSPFNIFGQIPASRLPMVGISYPSTEYHEFDYLCVDDAIGISDAVTKLKELGHTRIAYLGEKLTWYRQQWFETSMKANKLKVDPSLDLVSDERFEKAGYDLASQLINTNNIPTAVIAAYDDIAAGAADTFKAAGFRIPQDISICGIDYTQRKIGPDTILASVNCHIETQVDIALNTLIRKIENTKDLPSTVQNINLRTEFVPTNSIGPARTTEL